MSASCTVNEAVLVCLQQEQINTAVFIYEVAYEWICENCRNI